MRRRATLRNSINSLCFGLLLCALVIAAVIVEAKEVVACVLVAVIAAAVLIWCFSSPCRPTVAPDPVTVTHSILEN